MIVRSDDSYVGGAQAQSAGSPPEIPMPLALTPDETRFRDEVRDFLARELTPELRQAGRRCSGIFTEYHDGNRWHRILAKQGWSVPNWPVEHGGTGWTPMQHHIFASELSAANAPPRAPMGPGMVAPVIIKFGTPEQKARWLPGIRSGEDYWCQGYSEPQSGSDLASLQCKAVRDGEHYVINGTKIWTTHAQYANRMFCLVRTTSGGKPQAGISFLCFDMDTPGITVRPIISISGDHELNQVFFDNVRVPADSLIGEENQGWTVAKYLLLHERGGSYAPAMRARVQRLQAVADATFVGGRDPDEADAVALQLAELDCAIDAMEALEGQSLQATMRGEPAGIRPSIGKTLGSELKQRITELGVQLAAHYGSVQVPLDDSLAEGLAIPEEPVFAMSAYLNDRAASIYAGSSEVQRNIISAHLLAN
jgi:alkylation response protein AidB-like acyl-CoA dehydrogenase